jgi:hypothetical protein
MTLRTVLRRLESCEEVKKVESITVFRTG